MFTSYSHLKVTAVCWYFSVHEKAVKIPSRKNRSWNSASNLVRYASQVNILLS